MVVPTESAAGQKWRDKHEIVRMRPKGRSGLRVRGTLRQAIGDDLPGALCAPPQTPADVRRSAFSVQTPSTALISMIPSWSGCGSRTPDHAGGQWITAPAPQDTIPVLAGRQPRLAFRPLACSVGNTPAPDRRQHAAGSAFTRSIRVSACGPNSLSAIQPAAQ